MGDLQFIVLADTQFGMFAHSSGKTPEQIAEARSRGLIFRSAPKFDGLAPETALFEDAVRRANSIRPRFVVICGDLVNDPVDDSQQRELRRITGLLDPAIRMRFVPGNHDVAFDTTHPTPESLERYRSAFGADYYAFDEGGTAFIAVNTTVIQQPAGVPGEWEAQLEFVGRSLHTARSNGAQRVVIFGHHPLFVVDPDEDDSYWNIPRERRALLLKLLRQSRVDAMFAGHLHRNTFAEYDGLQMVSSGPVGYPLGDDPSGYRVVEVGRNGVQHDYRPLTPLAGEWGQLEPA
jgi:3',5'-cyclic AMP phosphodiesterase CpdA